MFDYFLFISMNLDHFSKTNNFFNNYKNQNKKEKKNLTWISFFFCAPEIQKHLLTDPACSRMSLLDLAKPDKAFI